jgi:hypothetical protein
MWFAISAVVAVIIVAGLFYLGNRGGASNSSNIEGVEFLAEAGRGHVEGEVAYPDAVPSGGQHNPVWQNCGIYDEPLRPENAIHSLEHGAVWVAYQPNLPADQVELLREAVRQARRNFGQSMVLLSPQPDLTTPIELVAWRVRLRVEQAADGRIAEFLATYQKGPFTPEPAASCINGIGTPLE